MMMACNCKDRQTSLHVKLAWVVLSLSTVLLFAEIVFASPRSLQSAASDAPNDDAPSVSLLKDQNFSRGLLIQHPDQRNRTFVDTFYPIESEGSGNPEWTIPQWHSRNSIAGVLPHRLPDGGVEYRNSGKRLVFGPGNRFILGLNSSDRGLHTSPFIKSPNIKSSIGISQNTWVPGGSFRRLTDLERVDLSLAARLTKAEFLSTARDHTAAVAFIGLHIRNVNPASHDLIYFVMPLYDSRERTRRPVRLIDRASKRGFFIYGTGNYPLIGNRSFHDKEWISIRKNILPLIKDAVRTALSEPKYSNYSKSLSDYTVSLFSVRWEMSADMNVEMEFKDLDLSAVLLPNSPNLSIVADPNEVVKRGSTEVSWDATNVAGECVVRNGDETLARGNVESKRISDLKTNIIVSLECNRLDGRRETHSVTIRVPNTSCKITASPPATYRNNAIKLSWESRNATRAEIRPRIGEVPTVGMVMVTQTSRTNYIMSVLTEDGRTRQCNVVVPILAP